MKKFIVALLILVCFAISSAAYAMVQLDFQWNGPEVQSFKVYFTEDITITIPSDGSRTWQGGSAH